MFQPFDNSQCEGESELNKNLQMYLDQAKRSVNVKVFTCKVYRKNKPRRDAIIYFTNRIQIGASQHQSYLQNLHDIFKQGSSSSEQQKFVLLQR